jgi:hypothetical protein
LSLGSTQWGETVRAYFGDGWSGSSTRQMC